MDYEGFMKMYNMYVRTMHNELEMHVINVTLFE